MSRMKKTCSMMMMAVMLAAPSFIMASPVVLKAQTDSRQAKYDACMDAAEEHLERCLAAARRELPCWVRYGYEKAGCTVSLGIRSIVSIFR